MPLFATDFYFGKSLSELERLHSAASVVSKSTKAIRFRMKIGSKSYEVEYQIRNGVSVAASCGIDDLQRTVSQSLDDFAALVGALATHANVEETDVRLNGVTLAGVPPADDDPPNYIRIRGKWSADHVFMASLEGTRKETSVERAKLSRFGFMIVPRVKLGNAPL